MAFIKSASKLTLRAYVKDLDQAFAQSKIFSDPKIVDEKPLLMACRAAQMSWAELSPASRNRKTATLKSFLGYLFQKGLIGTDLRWQLHSIKVPRKIPNFLSVDEAVVCLRSFSLPDEIREKTLFLLLYGSGLRVAEACGLKWAAIDLERKILKVLGKGGKERLVPFPDMSKNILQKLRAENPISDFVFGNKALDTRVAYNWVRQRGTIAGLMRPIHPHSLRHSFATHLLTGGANLRILQELLGHQSLQATEKYTHLNLNQLARTMDQFHPLNSKIGKKLIK